ncbi:unnamed protein product [Phaeothamnion confervicola]
MARDAAPPLYRNAADAFVTILRTEGIGLRGLQSGLLPGMAYQMMMNGTRLALFERLQRLLHADSKKDPRALFFAKNLFAGATTGAIGASIGSPFFLVKARLQSQNVAARMQRSAQIKTAYHYSGTLDGLRTIYSAEGVRGLWRGVDGAVPRVMVGSAVQLSIYNQCKRLVISAGLAEDTFVCHVASSLVAGLAVTTAMNPLDVVSTRLYCSDGSQGYKGPLDCLVRTVRVEGTRGLFKGWGAHYLRLGPHTVYTFCFWESYKKLATSVGF